MLTPEQIAERKNYIGASEAAAVLGLDEWKTPLEVWSEKTGKVPHEDIGEKMSIKLGNAFEDFVARQFMDETGLKVHKVNRTIHHPDHKFIACNLDREVYGEQVPLEIKTAGEFMAKEWKGDTAPTKYLVQVYHQMACTGAPYAYLAVLIGNRDFKWIKVERDESHIKTIISREVTFWREFVEPGIMPKVTRNDREALAKLYADAVGEVIPLTDDANRLIESIQGMKADLKRLTGDIDLEENRLKAMLGDKLGGTTGIYRVLWKPEGQERVDIERLRAEKPEIAKEYVKDIKYRKLYIKKNKEAK